jgi:hypothetical protein
LDQWVSALCKDTGVPEDYIDKDADIKFNEWIRVMIIDEDGKIKEMYDEHISEINLPKDIKDQIRNIDKDSMTFMIVKTDKNDKVLSANICFNVVPTSCNTETE